MCMFAQKSMSQLILQSYIILRSTTAFDFISLSIFDLTLFVALATKIINVDYNMFIAIANAKADPTKEFVLKFHF